MSEEKEICFSTVLFSTLIAVIGVKYRSVHVLEEMSANTADESNSAVEILMLTNFEGRITHLCIVQVFSLAVLGIWGLQD